MKQSLKVAEVLRRVAGLAQVKPLEARRVLDALKALVVEQARLDKTVKVPGFGSFTLATRKGRIVRNPATRELQHIPATKSVAFRAVGEVKKAVAR